LDDKALAFVPLDAAALRREIKAAFDGDPERAAEARIVLGPLVPKGLRLRLDAENKPDPSAHQAMVECRRCKPLDRGPHACVGVRLTMRGRARLTAGRDDGANH
jgi:hypothetical protein